MSINQRPTQTPDANNNQGQQNQTQQTPQAQPAQAMNLAKLSSTRNSISSRNAPKILFTEIWSFVAPDGATRCMGYHDLAALAEQGLEPRNLRREFALIDAIGEDGLIKLGRRPDAATEQWLASFCDGERQHDRKPLINAVWADRDPNDQGSSILSDNALRATLLQGGLDPIEVSQIVARVNSATQAPPTNSQTPQPANPPVQPPNGPPLDDAALTQALERAMASPDGPLAQALGGFIVQMMQGGAQTPPPPPTQGP